MTADEPVEAWDGVSDFYEEDEPAEDIKAAWEQGEHVVTAAPPSPSVPVESREQPDGGMQHRVDVAVIGMSNDRAERWKQRCFTARAELASMTAARDTCLEYWDYWERAEATRDEQLHEALAERDRARDLAAHLEAELDAILNPTGWIHLENANRDALCGSTATTTMSRVENADCSACLALAAHLEAEQAEERPRD